MACTAFCLFLCMVCVQEVPASVKPLINARAVLIEFNTGWDTLAVMQQLLKLWWSGEPRRRYLVSSSSMSKGSTDHGANKKWMMQFADGVIRVRVPGWPSQRPDMMLSHHPPPLHRNSIQVLWPSTMACPWIQQIQSYWRLKQGGRGGSFDDPHMYMYDILDEEDVHDHPRVVGSRIQAWYLILLLLYRESVPQNLPFLEEQFTMQIQC